VRFASLVRGVTLCVAQCVFAQAPAPTPLSAENPLPAAQSAPSPEKSVVEKKSEPLAPLSPGDCDSEKRSLRKASHQARHCKAAGDCVESPLLCPFDCNGLVNRAEVSRLGALYARYSETCPPCKYQCPKTRAVPMCLRERCVWKED
jgi:hypothetical protein